MHVLTYFNVFISLASLAAHVLGLTGAEVRTSAGCRFESRPSCGTVSLARTDIALYEWMFGGAQRGRRREWAAMFLWACPRAAMANHVA